MVEIGALKQIVIDGDGKKVIELVNAALAEGVTPQSLLTDHLIPGMVEVGQLMQDGEYFIPEVLKSAKAMNGALAILEPLLAIGGRESAGCVLMGTVDGDIHDIGKNLVCMLLKGGGFEVRDLGVSVPVQKFLEGVKLALQEREGKIVLGMSGLITPTLDGMPEVIKALEEAGLRDRVKVMVGGAPVTQEFCDSIGADGTAPDAPSTVALARSLLAA
ncbi:MAG: corrinoid protein [Syntrophales bacterium]|jgi:5-methyltetrahydrofolate--homocysteine methyltransferase|nr:corrinoid protein [Syntrophales bacterium]